MTRVLVVDDEPQMLKALQINLQARRYTVATATDGRRALTEATRNPPDAIILDLGLPEIDGIQVIHALRAWSAVPVIVLSGRADSTEKVSALDAGADDYVTKPFAMNELLARLRAALRRPTSEDMVTAPIRLGDYVIDLDSCVVRPASGDGSPVRLTPTEWRILSVLVQNPGRLVTGRTILQRVWGPGRDDKTNYLRVYFAGLRRKLEPDPAHPRYLLTEPGMGYRFEP
ncbi:response regulator [Streptacidiphilus fuscans]|uniref:Response regulator n=1 Tax=Streptacidiphilus fuscans TaxID=2789292 RepID=A0A931FB50_9ACTN|nr:response regulator [Streptacidiphilus fuscans]MBF9068312.1 response regulator [Streptacidiphilus fuscans]